MNALVLLDVGELLERLVAVGARVLANVAVNERVLCQLLRRRERLQTLAALVSLLLHTMRLLGVTLHVRLVSELLQHVTHRFYSGLDWPSCHGTGAPLRPTPAPASKKIKLSPKILSSRPGDTPTPLTTPMPVGGHCDKCCTKRLNRNYRVTNQILSLSLSKFSNIYVTAATDYKKKFID